MVSSILSGLRLRRRKSEWEVSLNNYALIREIKHPASNDEEVTH